MLVANGYTTVQYITLPLTELITALPQVPVSVAASISTSPIQDCNALPVASVTDIVPIAALIVIVLVVA